MHLDTGAIGPGNEGGVPLDCLYSALASVQHRVPQTQPPLQSPAQLNAQSAWHLQAHMVCNKSFTMSVLATLFESPRNQAHTPPGFTLDAKKLVWHLHSHSHDLNSWTISMVHPRLLQLHARELQGTYHAAGKNHPTVPVTTRQGTIDKLIQLRTESAMGASRKIHARAHPGVEDDFPRVATADKLPRFALAVSRVQCYALHADDPHALRPCRPSDNATTQYGR